MTEAGKMRTAAGTALLALIAAGFVPAVAAEAEPPRGVFSAQFDNDLFQGTDQNYTSGARFSYVAPMAPSHPLRSFARALPLVEGDLRVSYALAQKIFTPVDVSQTQPIPDDEPYAGYLYVGIGIEAEQRREGGRSILDSVELQVGVVGPAALGEQTQKAAHRLFGSEDPKGWDNQLNNEPAINLYYDRAWVGWYGTAVGPPESGYRIDLSPYVGAALGNVYTYAAAGATLRFGPQLPPSLGPSSIRPGSPGTNYYRPVSDMRWYLFAALEGWAYARNIFLDGNTFTDSQSVDKYPFVGELRLGFTMQLGRYQLTFSESFGTRQFHGQESNRFGTLSLSYAF
jgi:hypothetical protein